MRDRENALEFALRSVFAEHSERPMYLVLPCFLISSSVEIDSSKGVSINSWLADEQDPGEWDTHSGQFDEDSIDQV